MKFFGNSKIKSDYTQRPFKDWSLDRRIDRMLNDEEFRRHCFTLRQNPRFNEDFELAELIAQIDISRYFIDSNLIENQRVFTENEIYENAIQFYMMLDSLSPSGICLAERFRENFKYLYSDFSGNGGRSYCSSRKDENGERREIYVNFEGRIGDTINLIHEFCHSFSEPFIHFTGKKDKSVEEIPTVITDQLSSEFLKSIYPNLVKNFTENEKHTQFINVLKARESLLEGIIVKVMIGELSYNDAMDKYGKIFKNNSGIQTLQRNLDRIETYNFNTIMYESRYLVPQAIALEMRDKFKNNPREVATNLKEIIANVHTFTENEILELLGLPNKYDLIKDYVSKYEKRMQELEKDNIQKVSMEKGI